jgi:purine-nucleoside phosphorylase
MDALQLRIQEEARSRVTGYLEQVRLAADAARASLGLADVGIVLGSGLADAVPELEEARSLEYASIPGFPKPTVAGHAGKLKIGRLGEHRVAVLQGRLHYYEGHELGTVVLPLHVLKELGVRTLVVTSAVGSLRRSMPPGSLVILKDHINLMGVNPLRGLLGPEFGEMFPDMTQAYDPALRKLALRCAKDSKLRAKEGVYIAVAGPSYETPAEIRAFSRLGADVVGMSTVPEVIKARQLGFRILTVSWVANWAAGVSREQLKHSDVLELGRGVALEIRTLLEEVVGRLP